MTKVQTASLVFQLSMMFGSMIAVVAAMSIFVF